MPVIPDPFYDPFEDAYFDAILDAAQPARLTLRQRLRLRAERDREIEASRGIIEHYASKARERGVRDWPPDRIQLALFNAINGNVDMAVKALYDPSSVPPAYQGSFADQWDIPALADEVEKEGWAKVLKRLVTNPLVAFGAVLAVPFSVSSKEAIMRTLKVTRDYTRSIGFFERFIASPVELYKTRKGGMTLAGRLLLNIHREMESLRSTYSLALNNARVSYERAVGKPLDAETTVKIALALERAWEPSNRVWARLRRMTGKDVGPLPVKLTGPETILFKQLDGFRKDIYRRVIKPLQTSPRYAALREELARAGIRLSSRPGVSPDRYFPHQWYTDPERLAQQVSELVKAGQLTDAIALTESHVMRELKPPRGTPLAQLESELKGKKAYVPGPIRKRREVLLPAIAHVMQAPHLFKPGTVEALKEVVSAPWRFFSGGDIQVGEYSLDVMRVMGRYVDAISRFEAWTLSGRGKALTEEAKHVLRTNKLLGTLLTQVHIPLLRGELTLPQYIKASAWELWKVNQIKRLQTSKFFQSSEMGRKAATWLTEMLVSPSWFGSSIGISGRVASWLYLGALGGNIGAAFNNAMQTIATTANKIGYRNTLMGVSALMGKVSKYGRLRATGVPHDVAVRLSFPEYLAAGLYKGVGAAGEPFARALDQAWARSGMAGPVAARGETLWKRIRQLLMLPFQSVEQANWLIAFEGGLSAARRVGVTGERAIQFARQVVEETQFLSGPLMAPVAVAQLSPAWRMFTQYPLRLLGLYSGEAKRKNVGFFARAVAGQLAAIGLMREFGVDPTSGTAFEGLPFPRAGRPFSPLPIVPPVIGTIGAAAADIAGGEYDRLKYVWPMWMPGGLAATRLAALASPGMAEVSGRRFADWEHPDEQGRYPLYSADGAWLGNFSPTQIVLTGLGLSTPDVSAEQQALMMLRKQRKQIVAVMQAVREGLAVNDMLAVRKGVEEWERMFPGVPLPIKPSDIRALHDRRSLLRIEQVLKTMPRGPREQYAGMLNAALAERAFLPPEGVLPFSSDAWSLPLHQQEEVERLSLFGGMDVRRLPSSSLPLPGGEW